LLKKAKKATKRIDTNIDGFVDKRDKKSGPYGAFIPSVDGKGKLYTDLNVKNEDWQKINKGDKTDGMSPKAVKAYRRENPGSELKTAVTGDPNPGSKDAKRRKSFCARSKGQQDMHNIDCSSTPDKPVCKARRRWKC
jgi:hypothetical protein